jgi:hypothetical protein
VALDAKDIETPATKNIVKILNFIFWNFRRKKFLENFFFLNKTSFLFVWTSKAQSAFFSNTLDGFLAFVVDYIEHEANFVNILHM